MPSRAKFVELASYLTLTFPTYPVGALFSVHPEHSCEERTARCGLTKCHRLLF